MEDDLAPLAANVSKIRELISSLELCHHKAERWVDNIIEAIGAGETTKGLGTRPPGEPHPTERVWQDACAALSAWVAGCPATAVDLTIDTIPASRFLACLGERSSLKEWQVQRVIEKIRSAIDWPRSGNAPAARYEWLLLDAGEHELAYRNDCPELYAEHEDHWLSTVRTVLHDRDDGEVAELSLGVAIDLLMPCNWGFVENLQIVLDAIGGRLEVGRPFAACGRNIGLVPIRRRMEIVSNTLKLFCGAPVSDSEVDRESLALLGEAAGTSHWLAASLDKTIRLQLDPPAELRAMAALAGPEWIRQPGSG